MFEELAEAYVNSKADGGHFDLEQFGRAYFSESSVKQAFLAGLEAGRPKWHDLRKNPDDLPEMLHPVHVKLDSGTYVFAYCVNGIWHGNDDGIILYHGDGRSEVIAWCEIPKFEEADNA